MKKYFLLPHRFYAIGWVLVGVALLVGLLDFWGVLPILSSKMFSLFPDYHIWGNGADINVECSGIITTNDSWYDEIEMISAYVGLYFVSMSALKEEDEMPLLLRLRSLMWAFTVSTVFFITLVLVYGMYWIYILVCQEMFIFLLFILRFHWELYKMKITTSRNKEEDQ